MNIGDATLLTGDCIEIMATLPAASVNTCITSPPYFGLRDYGHDEQIGLESTPEKYVEKMVEVFRAVRRVLCDDGTVWLNLGDSYCASRTGACSQLSSTLGGGKKTQAEAHKRPNKTNLPGLKPKDLIGIPWHVALALQSDGWYLRQDIIWHKPNPMPESVTDRCTKSHEYIFMLTKNARYYYNHEAIKEQAIYSGITGMDETGYKDAERFSGKNGIDKQRGHGRRHAGFNDRWDHMSRRDQCSGLRNKRSVWIIATKPYPGAHFATFPPKLIEPCVLAGCPVDGVVLDPFSGSGTTGQVALQQGRKYIGIELNAEYQKLAVERITPHAQQKRLFA